MKPSKCLDCKRRFMRDYSLWIELRHHAAKYGARSAESELNERYEEFHVEHEHQRTTEEQVSP